LHFSLAGPRAIEVYRLCQIADVLDVSLDWLTGRSNVSASKNASNVPFRLSRQKRFQMLFQLPNSAGKARQVRL
jgi:hypothetical protein